MTWIDRGNLRGPAGTFQSVTATTLAPGAPATATIGGTLQNRSVVFGIPAGAQGIPGVNGVENDTAMATLVDGPSATNLALGASFVRNTVIMPGIAGIVGDGVTDDTAAIQARVDACPRGETLRLMRPAVGTGYYRLAGTLIFRTDAVKFAGPGDSFYSTALLVDASVAVAIRVEAAQVRFEQIAIRGQGGDYGQGATTVGIDYWGTTAGDVDGYVVGCSFSQLAVDVRTHGRNLLVQNNIMSNSLVGVHSMGMDVAYHTAITSTVIRGIRVKGNRFHGIGFTPTDACVLFTDHTDFQHSTIDGNYQDGIGRGRGVVAVGTSTATIKGLHLKGNSFNEDLASSVDLTYAEAFHLASNSHYGQASANFEYDAFVFTNCIDGEVAAQMIQRAGRSGIKVVASTNIRITAPRINNVGIATAAIGHGIDVDAASSNISIVDPFIQGATGYGINGSPTDSSIEGAVLINAATLGRINSTTLRGEVVVIPGATLTTISGTPSAEIMQQWPAKGLPDGASTWVGTFVTVPSGWRQFDVEAIFAPVAAGGGNVRLTSAVLPVVEGVPVGLGASQSNTVAVSGVAATVGRAAVSTTNVPPLSGVVGVRVARAGADALDTYTGVLALIALRLIRRR